MGGKLAQATLHHHCPSPRAHQGHSRSHGRPQGRPGQRGVSATQTRTIWIPLPAVLVKLPCLCCNTDSEQECSTDSHSAGSKAQGAQQPTTQPDERAPQSKEQSNQQINPSAAKLKAGQSGRHPHITDPLPAVLVKLPRLCCNTHHKPSPISHEGAAQGRRHSRLGWRSTKPATAASIRPLYF